jgi:hypothetical protein
LYFVVINVLNDIVQNNQHQVYQTHYFWLEKQY